MRRVAVAVALVLVAGVAACSQVLGISDPRPGSGGRDGGMDGNDGGDPQGSVLLVVTDGTGQHGPAGAVLPAPFVLSLTDGAGKPIAGATVNFVITEGSGSVSPLMAMTDPSGHVQTTLTLGPAAGQNIVDARAAAFTGVHALISAVGQPGPASRTLVTGGQGQTAVAGAELPDPIAVRVEDALHNGIPGAPVAVSVTGGGGSVMMSALTTDATGEASTTWTTGTIAGTNTVRVTGPASASIDVTATAIAGAPARFQLASGDGQLPTQIASQVANPLVVQVTDVNANPVQGVSVSYVVTGGSLVPPGPVSTDGGGLAQVSVVPAVSGKVTVTASVSGFPDVVFSTFVLGLAPAASFPAGGGAVAIATADFNGDGKPDVAMAERSDVSILLDTTAQNAVTPTFATKVELVAAPSGGGTIGVAAGDLDGDGRPDLAVTDQAGTSFGIFLDTTAPLAQTATFGARSDVTVGTEPIGIALGDLNQDGKVDVVVASFQSNVVSVLLNTTASAGGPLTFAPRLDFTTGTGPQGVAIGDLDGDGAPDLVVANFTAQSISVLRNLTAPNAATASFAAKVDLTTGRAARVAIGDLSGDGRLDLAVSNQTDGTIAVFFGKIAPGLTFFAPVEFAAGKPLGLDLRDLNGDGKPDLVAASDTGDATAGVVVLLNTTEPNSGVPSFSSSFSRTLTNPTGVCIADFNGDGKPDVAASLSSPAFVTAVMLSQ